MLHLKDLKIENIKIKKPYVDDKTVFKLFYGESPLYLQTGVHLLKFKPSFDVYDYCSVVLCDHKTDEHWKILEDLEVRVIERINKKYHEMCCDKTRIPLINQDKRLLRLRNKKSDIQVYDKRMNPISMSSLYPYDKVKVIMRIDHVWITKFTYGVCAYLIQILNLDAISENFDKPLLTPSTDEENHHVMSSDAFERFSKMLKVGIPANAVRQKMTLEGFDESEISRFLCRVPMDQNRVQQTTLMKSTPPPPPPRLPPPPPPPPAPLSSANPMAGVLSAIKGGLFKLKKATTTNASSNGGSKVVLKGVDTSRRVPSLTEILAAKNKLKKPSALNYLIE
jgi:hypothetical protein